MAVNPDPRPAPQDSGDDPRVDILAEAIASYYRYADDHVRADTQRRARDLLARLDAAAPADLAVLPAPDAWVEVQDSDDQPTRVPSWSLDTLVPGRAIAAWVNGVDVDGDLLEDVDAVERDALRVLAAVHAHRRHAGQDEGWSGSDTCPGCGRDTTRAVHGRPDFVECATCGDSWVRRGIDPAIHDALEVAWTLVGQWKAAAVARGCEGLPDAGIRPVPPTEVEAGDVARWDAGPCMVFAEQHWGRPRVSLAVQAPTELRDPCGLARALDAAAAWVDADRRLMGEDAAAPARDDTTVALPDPEGIERDGSMHWTVHDHTGDDEYGAEGETWTVQLDPAGVVHLDGHPIAPAADLARALLAAARVRERLGATTHTTPEGGTDDH